MGSASAIASAATRTALGDGQFGDNIRAAMPDVIGQAIANMAGNIVEKWASKPIEVTAPAGTATGVVSKPAIGVLDTASKADPTLDDLVSNRKQFNMKRIYDVWDRRSRIVETRDAELADAKQVKLGFEKDLKAASDAGAEPEEIRRIEKQISRADRTVQRRVDRLQRSQERFNEQGNKFLAALSAEESLQNYFVDKFISTSTGPYQIRGPRFNFSTPEESAVDAIALGLALSEAMEGRFRERTGYINKTEVGFNYHNTIKINGKETSISLHSGAEYGSAFAPQRFGANEIAIFHIHPIGANQSEYLAGRYFGPDDLKATHALFRNINEDSKMTPLSSIDHYLGGSDGGIRVVKNVTRFPEPPSFVGSEGKPPPVPVVADYIQLRDPGYFQRKF